MSLRQIQSEAGAEFMNYGPLPAEGGVEVVQSFGEYPAEYAAIRQRVGLMHLPQRGLIEVRGADRADFLQRMLTQDVLSLAPGEGRRAFMLNGKGRIIADLIVLHEQDRTLLDLDRLDVAALLSMLESRLFSEDVQLSDATDRFTHFALHGPASVRLLNAAAETEAEAAGLALLHHRPVTLSGAAGVVYRRDDAGALGLHVLVPSEAAAGVYQRLLDVAGFDPREDAEPDEDYAKRRREGLRGRPVGWLAYNTARIEAGTGIFHIDFGYDSLPGETGVLDETVSFTKGCYLGQEIVARMQHLGHPKRVLVGVKFASDALPVAGSQVFEGGAETQEKLPGGAVVGGVTSSTLSPILGQQAIGFAVMKWSHRQAGTPVRVFAEGAAVEGEVHTLNFLGGGK